MARTTFAIQSTKALLMLPTCSGKFFNSQEDSHVFPWQSDQKFFYFSAAKHLVKNGQIISTYFDHDGIHLSHKGATVIAKELVQFLDGIK